MIRSKFLSIRPAPETPELLDGYDIAGVLDSFESDKGRRSTGLDIIDTIHESSEADFPHIQGRVLGFNRHVEDFSGFDNRQLSVVNENIGVFLVSARFLNPEVFGEDRLARAGHVRLSVKLNKG